MNGRRPRNAHQRERRPGWKRCVRRGEICTREARWGNSVSADVPRVKGDLLFSSKREGETPKSRVEPRFAASVPYGAEVFFVFWGVFVMKDLKKDLDDLGELISLVGHTGKKLYRKSQGLVREVRYDIAAFRQRDPAAKSDLEVLLLYSGLHARTAHRLSHALYKNGHTFAARAVSQGAKALTGIEIHPGATIGKGLVIDHGSGVVIGETAEIGDNCTLYQGVTLGGTGKDVGKRHPTLGNNVMVGAGAKILGPMKIGDNTKIAAGAVVLDEIPADSTAVGIPAKVVKVAGERVANDLDQIHIPDPVAQELSAVRAELQALEDKIKKLEKKKTAPRKPAVKK